MLQKRFKSDIFRVFTKNDKSWFVGYLASSNNNESFLVHEDSSRKIGTSDKSMYGDVVDKFTGRLDMMAVPVFVNDIVIKDNKEYVVIGSGPFYLIDKKSFIEDDLDAEVIPLEGISIKSTERTIHSGLENEFSNFYGGVTVETVVIRALE